MEFFKGLICLELKYLLINNPKLLQSNVILSMTTFLCMYSNSTNKKQFGSYTFWASPDICVNKRFTKRKLFNQIICKLRILDINSSS